MRQIIFSRKRTMSILAGIILLALTLSACGQAQPSAQPEGSEANPAAADRTVTDAMGHKVTIPANPQRVLAPYLEDPLVTLGVTPVAQWSVQNGKKQDYLEQYLKDVPLMPYDMPPEQVLEVQPDLIIINSESMVQKGLYEQYSAIAPTYVLGDEIASDWRQSLLKIGELLNKQAEAEKAASDYDAKVAAAKEELQGVAGDQSAAVLWLTQKNFYVVDPEKSSGAVLYGDLGLKAPALTQEADSDASWTAISLEKLPELDADYIFLINSNQGASSETLERPIWKSLPAVQNGHVFSMDSKGSWLYSGKIANEAMVDDVLKSIVK
ncbi:iron-hydroxamate ABC transporter substrate-binding protein [Paenibacillus sp. P96]|uniref:Iron-hydroxamate ABC transporter substrate-binding protein n=1 Tax=Paenibacillus zeirhizosphaerae TaxID=2987519 RepID=A0ABT9FN45_9BACL|nr:iron-hydroxamate ABC transporter substrate-binding protein [Paenibacillus sp. P96]MDP4096133.1 iron-hydroxamate ABC transporter substrate-binding protein [Paenibacillus sp. P96]